MLRLVASLLILSTMLTACGSTAGPTAGPTVKPTSGPTTDAIQTVVPPSPSPQADSPTESHEDRSKPDNKVWSLGGNGWALALGDRLLVFDYVESTDPNPPAAGEARDLRRGYIDTKEIKDYEVYVFVTHSHPDHYDPVIYEWQDGVDDIVYFFGWEAGDSPEHHYLVGPRAETEAGSVEVYTINTRHADVPEVAFLVKVGGVWIYHSGDYMASYSEDFDFLKTISDHIDIAFLIGWPYPDHQQFQQAILFTELFTPEYLFASCREGDEEKCRQFADLLAESGVDATIQYPARRGDVFEISRSEID